MAHITKTRPAADIALGFAADGRGTGVAFATIATGTARSTVRLGFRFKPLAALEGKEAGYAAVAALAAHIKARGFGRIRVRVADAGLAAELSGQRNVGPALGMAYVKTRCALYAFTSARIEAGEAVEIADLQARARAEVSLTVAA